MDKAQTEEKLAVECGYWHNFVTIRLQRTKFTLDSKAPTGDYQSILKVKVRYASGSESRMTGALDARTRKARLDTQYLNKLVTLYTNNY